MAVDSVEDMKVKYVTRFAQFQIRSEPCTFILFRGQINSKRAFSLILSFFSLRDKVDHRQPKLKL